MSESKKNNRSSYARVIGTGSYLPQEIVSNADLEKRVETTDEWIMQRVGIRKRHVIGDSQDNTTTMSLAAAKNAIEAAGIDANEIDMIVVGTATPKMYFPSTACELQGLLGIDRDIPAFDVNAACAGFVYALSVVDQYFRSGAIKKALVIGADSLTQLVDWQDRGTCILFGDGAGAVVLGEDPEFGIINTHVHANGKYADLITSNNPIWNDDNYKVKMRGGEVFKIAVRKLGEMVDQTLEQGGIKKEDIDWLVPHQANMRIIAALAKRLNMPLSRVVLTIEEHGNTSAASIPLALDAAVRAGTIKREQTLLLDAFGAGLAWGSTLLTY